MNKDELKKHLHITDENYQHLLGISITNPKNNKQIK